MGWCSVDGDSIAPGEGMEYTLGSCGWYGLGRIPLLTGCSDGQFTRWSNRCSMNHYDLSIQAFRDRKEDSVAWLEHEELGQTINVNNSCNEIIIGYQVIHSHRFGPIHLQSSRVPRAMSRGHLLLFRQSVRPLQDRLCHEWSLSSFIESLISP